MVLFKTHLEYSAEVWRYQDYKLTDSIQNLASSLFTYLLFNIAAVTNDTGYTNIGISHEVGLIRVCTRLSNVIDPDSGVNHWLLD